MYNIHNIQTIIYTYIYIYIILLYIYIYIYIYIYMYISNDIIKNQFLYLILKDKKSKNGMQDELDRIIELLKK